MLAASIDQVQGIQLGEVQRYLTTCWQVPGYTKTYRMSFSMINKVLLCCTERPKATLKPADRPKATLKPIDRPKATLKPIDRPKDTLTPADKS